MSKIIKVELKSVDQNLLFNIEINWELKYEDLLLNCNRRTAACLARLLTEYKELDKCCGWIENLEFSEPVA